MERPPTLCGNVCDREPSKLGVLLACCCSWALQASAADAGLQQRLAVHGTYPHSAEARSAALNGLFADYWEDHLSHTPEDATTLGDKRYNDCWSDYSVAAINQGLRRNSRFLQRLRTIDPAGLSEQERLSAVLLQRILEETEEGARYKEWELPVSQIHGPDIDIPQLVAMGPTDSPFAAPIKKLPDSLSAAERERLSHEIVMAIGQDVIPAYRRSDSTRSGGTRRKCSLSPGRSATPT